MLNIEKYKDNILNAAQSDITCCVIDLFHNGVCPVKEEMGNIATF